MDGFLVRLVLVCIAAVIFVLLLRPRPVFVIRIAGGNVRVKRGRVPKGFLSECELLVQENNLKNITIRGVKKRGSVHLKFSGPIPEAAVQRFRNVWRQYT